MNIQRAVEEYLSGSKGTKDCLRTGLINYSALSRQICKEVKIPAKHFDAVLIACRRYGDKLRKKPGAENQVRQILKNSNLEIKNKVAVAVVEKNIFFNNLLSLNKEVKAKNELFRVIEGVNAITVITSQEFLGRVKQTFKNKIIRINENLIEVTVKSSADLENVPGVMAYLYSLFGDKEINIVETMSCWTDTIFVIEEKDLGNVMDVLKF
ncbi:MAG: ACT domain-containing protein [Nanoarchaeota archaeon]|nr:ACT domain-containing protein [Nanoarchaeota archaeon]